MKMTNDNLDGASTCGVMSNGPQGHSLDRDATTVIPTAPLVSLIIINYNYGRFLRQTICSVMAQTYPNVECVIVDNNSEDDSIEVIRESIAGDPRFRLIQLDSNRLSMVAAVRGLRETSGEFVCFIDADDYLFPEFVARHVHAHTSISPGVALTSSNVAEVSDSNELLCGTRPYRSIGRSESKIGTHALAELALTRLWDGMSAENYVQLKENSEFFPRTVAGWMWGPGTANVYRRTVLKAFAPDESIVLKDTLAVDGHFCRLCHWMTGSVVINIPSSAYRIHSDNVSAAMPSVNGFLGTERRFASRMAWRRQVSLKIVMENREKISALVGSERFFFIVARLIQQFAAYGSSGLRSEDSELSSAISEALSFLFANTSSVTVARMFGGANLKSIRTTTKGIQDKRLARKLWMAVLREKIRRFDLVFRNPKRPQGV